MTRDLFDKIERRGRAGRRRSEMSNLGAAGHHIPRDVLKLSPFGLCRSIVRAMASRTS